MLTASMLSQTQLQVLAALAFRGPLLRHTIQRESELSALLANELAVPICAEGEEGYVALTLLGRNVLCARLKCTRLPEALEAYRNDPNFLSLFQNV